MGKGHSREIDVYRWEHNSRTQSSNLSDIKCSTSLITGKEKDLMSGKGKSKIKSLAGVNTIDFAVSFFFFS